MVGSHSAGTQPGDSYQHEIAMGTRLHGLTLKKPSHSQSSFLL